MRPGTRWPPNRGQQPEFLGQPGLAGVPLGHRRLVGGRCAAHRGHHPGVQQPLPVAGRRAVRLGGQPAPVQGREQHVTAAVPGEDPAGPVAAVRRGRQAKDEDARLIAAPARDGPAPVRLGGMRPALDPGHLFPPGDQPGAGPAHRLPGGQLGQAVRTGRERADLRRQPPPASQGWPGRRASRYRAAPDRAAPDRLAPGYLAPGYLTLRRPAGSPARRQRPGDAVQDVVLTDQHPGAAEPVHDVIQHHGATADHVHPARVHDAERGPLRAGLAEQRTGSAPRPGRRRCVRDGSGSDRIRPARARGRRWWSPTRPGRPASGPSPRAWPRPPGPGRPRYPPRPPRSRPGWAGRRADGVRSAGHSRCPRTAP